MLTVVRTSGTSVVKQDIFCGRHFGSNIPEILSDYNVPDIFPKDLFGVMGEIVDCPHLPK